MPPLPEGRGGFRLWGQGQARGIVRDGEEGRGRSCRGTMRFRACRRGRGRPAACGRPGFRPSGRFRLHAGGVLSRTFGGRREGDGLYGSRRRVGRCCRRRVRGDGDGLPLPVGGGPVPPVLLRSSGTGPETVAPAAPSGAPVWTAPGKRRVLCGRRAAPGRVKSSGRLSVGRA